jgi:organic radical activating enzyme
MGKSAFFIRTYGCPLHCPWCDSAGTWHKDWIPKKVEKLSVQQLHKEAEACNPSFICVTGGEPAIHKWKHFVEVSNLPVHMETSGAYPLDYTMDWLTVSPKPYKKPLRENIKFACEIKIIVEDEESIERWTEVIIEENPFVPVWLHPEWGKREDPVVLKLISDYVKDDHPIAYRAGWQIHKMYECDALDSRSAKKAPLGGKEENGY